MFSPRFLESDEYPETSRFIQKKFRDVISPEEKGRYEATARAVSYESNAAAVQRNERGISSSTISSSGHTLRRKHAGKEGEKEFLGDEAELTLPLEIIRSSDKDREIQQGNWFDSAETVTSNQDDVSRISTSNLGILSPSEKLYLGEKIRLVGQTSQKCSLPNGTWVASPRKKGLKRYERQSVKSTSSSQKSRTRKALDQSHSSAKGDNRKKEDTLQRNLVCGKEERSIIEGIRKRDFDEHEANYGGVFAGYEPFSYTEFSGISEPQEMVSKKGRWQKSRKVGTSDTISNLSSGREYSDPSDDRLHAKLASRRKLSNFSKESSRNRKDTDYEAETIIFDDKSALEIKPRELNYSNRSRSRLNNQEVNDIHEDSARFSHPLDSGKGHCQNNANKKYYSTTSLHPHKDNNRTRRIPSSFQQSSFSGVSAAELSLNEGPCTYETVSITTPCSYANVRDSENRYTVAHRCKSVQGNLWYEESYPSEFIGDMESSLAQLQHRKGMSHCRERERSEPSRRGSASSVIDERSNSTTLQWGDVHATDNCRIPFSNVRNDVDVSPRNKREEILNAQIDKSPRRVRWHEARIGTSEFSCSSEREINSLKLGKQHSCTNNRSSSVLSLPPDFHRDVKTNLRREYEKRNLQINKQWSENGYDDHGTYLSAGRSNLSERKVIHTPTHSHKFVSPGLYPQEDSPRTLRPFCLSSDFSDTNSPSNASWIPQNCASYRGVMMHEDESSPDCGQNANLQEVLLEHPAYKDHSNRYGRYGSSPCKNSPQNHVTGVNNNSDKESKESRYCYPPVNSEACSLDMDHNAVKSHSLQRGNSSEISASSLKMRGQQRIKASRIPRDASINPPSASNYKSYETVNKVLEGIHSPLRAEDDLGMYQDFRLFQAIQGRECRTPECHFSTSLDDEASDRRQRSYNLLMASSQQGNSQRSHGSGDAMTHLNSSNSGFFSEAAIANRMGLKARHMKSSASRLSREDSKNLCSTPVSALAMTREEVNPNLMPTLLGNSKKLRSLPSTVINGSNYHSKEFSDASNEHVGNSNRNSSGEPYPLLYPYQEPEMPQISILSGNQLEEDRFSAVDARARNFLYSNPISSEMAAADHPRLPQQENEISPEKYMSNRFSASKCVLPGTLHQITSTKSQYSPDGTIIVKRNENLGCSSSNITTCSPGDGRSSIISSKASVLSKNASLSSLSTRATLPRAPLQHKFTEFDMQLLNGGMDVLVRSGRVFDGQNQPSAKGVTVATSLKLKCNPPNRTLDGGRERDFRSEMLESELATSPIRSPLPVAQTVDHKKSMYRDMIDEVEEPVAPYEMSARCAPKLPLSRPNSPIVASKREILSRNVSERGFETSKSNRKMDQEKDNALFCEGSQPNGGVPKQVDRKHDLETSSSASSVVAIQMERLPSANLGDLAPKMERTASLKSLTSETHHLGFEESRIYRICNPVASYIFGKLWTSAPEETRFALCHICVWSSFATLGFGIVVFFIAIFGVMAF